MKKIVFVSLMMADAMNKRTYPVDGNVFIEYDKDVYYAINGVLAKTLKEKDDVKVVLLETKAGDKSGTKNAQLFMEELNHINEINKIGANISYEIIPSDFITSKNKYNELFLKLVKTLENEAEIYADITFGPKSLPLLIFSAIQFGEKFFDCSIGNVIYLKAEFKNNVLVEGTQLVCDYTPMYLLNSMINTFENTSKKNVINIFEKILKD